MVWVTVPVPTILIVILLIRGATLEGAGKGVMLYLTGEEGLNFGEELSKASIWSDA